MVMTVVQATTLLIGWYRKRDFFTIENDFIKIINLTDEPEADKACVLSALNGLKEHGVLAENTVDGKSFYTLKKPIDSYEQTLEIDLPTATLVAETLNDLCYRLDGFAKNADPTELKVEDLRNLAGIVGALLPEDPEEELNV